MGWSEGSRLTLFRNLLEQFELSAFGKIYILLLATLLIADSPITYYNNCHQEFN